MNLAELAVSVASTLGISAAGFWLAGRLWFSHFLDKKIAKAKIDWEGDKRHKVDSQLNQEQAQREYEYEARKRLYTAIGPLRFQLLIACRDCANRIATHSKRNLTYSMSLKGYYGQSTAYRILRPLALAELAERQISYTDFSVESDALDILKFKRAAYSALSSKDAIANHDTAIWEYQKEHFFYDSLNRISNCLTTTDGDQPRSYHSHEFAKSLKDKEYLMRLAPLPEILDSFSLETTPLLWTRLVCYAQTCAMLVNRQGPAIGFEPIDIEVDNLLTQSSVSFTEQQIQSIKDHLESSFTKGL